ncbi:MAG TPA: LuxR C-terminal-related transcriptional regulator [Clostridiales bacterium]|nr:LuxR C-terminal-related transcriptional regulator [Clostridiales bacterium]
MERTILSTKLLIPKPRKGYVVRKNLFRRLDDVTTKRLAVIQGVPGSGKTTLLTSYMEQNTLNCRWITLDGECNHVALFWEYILEALSGSLEKPVGSFTTFLQASVEQSTNKALKVLINAINQTEDIVLALDDFHLIDNDELLRSFEYFLANIPANVHVVLLTREKPEIYLAGYEMRGELLHIDEQDLTLSDEEGIQFLKQTLFLSLPDERLLELVHTADGWIGGLQLLAASVSGNAAPKAAHSLIHVGMLYEYISGEIFNRLTPEEQDFLILTSVASYFNRNIVECLLPELSYEDMLSDLLHQNLMIQCIDEKQGLYQYHNLFRDYLLSRFEQLNQETKAQTYRMLVHVFHELGDEDESLRHLFVLEDYSLAMIRILELPTGATHYNYMSKVPVDKAVENFDFAIQKFYYHYYIYDYDTCNALYEKGMLHRTQDERFGAFDGFPQIYGSEAFNISDDLILPRKVRDMDMLPLTRAMVLTKNAVFLFYQNQYIAALESVNESLSYEKTTPSTYIHYFNLMLKTQICEEMGLLNKALAVQEQMRQLIERNEMLRHLHTPTFSLTAAGLYMKQMRLEEAGDILDECAEAIAERGGQLQLSYDYNRIEYLFLTGDIDKAVDLLNSLMATESYQDILMVSSLLQHQYHAGAMTKAMQDRFISAYESKLKDMCSLSSRLLYARILAAQGERQKALSEVDEVLRIARKQESHLKIVEATLQRLSVMIRHSYDLRRLMDLYKEALYHACDNNIRMPFYLEADTIAALHRQYSNKLFSELSKTENAFQQGIVKLYVKKDKGILSEREQEIIHLMAEGLSNHNVSERLFITVPTVKTHVSNIFRKLETNTRLEAVTKARQMGLLDE